MTEDVIKQIMINDRLVGLVGLETTVKKLAKSNIPQSDDEIEERLLELISINNYIPASARQAYGKALLREFKIVQGLPVAPEHVPGLIISVLGMGCARCSQLESDVRDILSELKIAADLRHISDFKEIAFYGVMGSPALVVNDKVVSVGEVPPKSKIRQWIIDAHLPQDTTSK
jgi:small redox-active disulfide protein 2